MDFVDQTGNTYLIVFTEAFKDYCGKNFGSDMDMDLIKFLYTKDKNMNEKMLKQVISDIDSYDLSLKQLMGFYSKCLGSRKIFLNKLFNNQRKHFSLEEIDSCSTSYNKTGNIALQIPIYPFQIDLSGYDFTINTLHISLYDILLSNTFIYDKNIKDSTKTNKNIEFIDFNWHTKLFNFNIKDITNKRKVFDIGTDEKNKENEEHDENVLKNMNKTSNKDELEMRLIADYNHLGIQHLESKILTMPCIDSLNATTANFYFWRFVKLCEKFIDKLQANIWYIDNEYLKRTIYFYNCWFLDENNEYTNLRILEQNFIRKLLKWSVNMDSKTQENIYYKRFRVFHYIYFDDYFKYKLTYDDLFRHAFESWIIHSPVLNKKAKKDIKECFEVCKLITTCLVLY